MNVAYAIPLIVLLTIVACTRNRNVPSWDRTRVTSISGKVFLDGPDGPRTAVNIQDAQAIEEVVELLKLGNQISDRKEPGVAVLFLFSNGEKVATIELTRYDLARINGLPYSIDSEALIEIIRRCQQSPREEKETDE